MFRAVEWGCSLAGGYGFAWLLRWLDVPRFWFVIVFLSLSVCAVYRTARLDPGPAFGTGPAILLSPEVLDAVPVAAGMAIFAWHSSRLERRSHSPTRSLPSGVIIAPTVSGFFLGGFL